MHEGVVIALRGNRYSVVIGCRYFVWMVIRLPRSLN